MQRSRLQKQVRLLKAADFDRVFDKSVRSSDRYFTVLARPNELNHPRLGLAISKRRVRLAVGRCRSRPDGSADAARALEADGVIGKLHEFFYVTTGTGTTVTHGERIGDEIAKQLINEGVHAVIVTST